MLKPVSSVFREVVNATGCDVMQYTNANIIV